MKLKSLIIVFSVLLLFSCKDDFLDTAPEETISSEQLAQNPTALQAIINGIYASLRTFGVGGTTRHVDYGHMGIVAGLDMMSNDISMTAFHWYGFFYNYDGRTQDASRTSIIWITYYSQVAEANSIINSFEQDPTDESAKAILGQALALKSFSLFNLARIYAFSPMGHDGDKGVPLPDGASFDGKPRSAISDVYTRITADLERAIPLLANFSRSSTQELDQSVAQGLLAKVYLETGNWAGAADMAAQARANYSLMTSDEWLDGFSDISNSEWMWGADIDNESSTVFASFFSHFDNTNNGYAGALAVYKTIDNLLYDAIPFTDVRKSAFVDPINGHPDYPALAPLSNIKFRDPSFFEGDYVYMRASEMVLVEAEAKARMGAGDAADVLFELVSTRDPGYVVSSNTDAALVEEIYFQRRVELWGEGTAWFDLKRLGKPLERDYVGSNHASFGLFNFPVEDLHFQWQIPEDEINANDAIPVADQNP